MTEPAGQPLRFDYHQREEQLLASYAMYSRDSAGRRHAEPPHPYRGPFQRDRDRIVHSSAYRRLSHKTQVLAGELGDYHRTRLTHTLEVASIACTLARALRLNEDLVEALALAHDIGHPPFGHAGEDVLDECLQDVGGFNHNRQALRIVELLESRYAEFPGLNLTIETLDGQTTRAEREQATGSPLLEVQVVDAADSIAYDTHDADDALEHGLVCLDEIRELPLWREAARRVGNRVVACDEETQRRVVIHELIEWQVSDLIAGASDRLPAFDGRPAAAVRAAPRMIVPSPPLLAQKEQFEAFLYDRVYRHPDVTAERAKAQAMLREMFAVFIERPDLLPEKFQQRAAEDALARSVGDYLAGMTDRFLQQEHARMCES